RVDFLGAEDLTAGPIVGADTAQREMAGERVVVHVGDREPAGRQRGESRLERQRQRAGGAEQRRGQRDEREQRFHAARRVTSAASPPAASAPCRAPCVTTPTSAWPSTTGTSPPRARPSFKNAVHAESAG